MEGYSKIPTPEQMRIRGQYENHETDTASLAAELGSNQDLSKLVADFDQGTTPLRDVGNMVTAQRTAILEAYANGSIVDLSRNHLWLFDGPVKELRKRIPDERMDTQPVGHNFFVNAVGFLNAGRQWAKDLDDLVRSKFEFGIVDLSRLQSTQENNTILNSIVEEMTDLTDTEMTRVLGTYLAGRSLEGEQYLQREYGEGLKKAKVDASKVLEELSRQTGLNADMLKRANLQIERTTFGSFDHLNGLVTSGNSGSMGDYLSGSLRVEVHFEGDVRTAKSRTYEQALPIISHELHHAASAQSVNEGRIGLKSMDKGLEANEAMTELLSQLTNETSGIKNVNGGLNVDENVSYRVPVIAMLALHQEFISGRSEDFAILFNAYHGDVRDVEKLKKALDKFYLKDKEVADMISRIQ